MDEELSPCHFLKALIIRGMVKMAMGIDDINAAQFILGERDENPVGITSRIDNGCFSCSLTAHDVAI